MWIFWVIFAAFLICGWRFALIWRARRADANGTITDSSDNQGSTQNQSHLNNEIEEVIEEEELPSVDPPSSVASTDPQSSLASPGFHSPSWSQWNEWNCIAIAGLGGLIVGYLTSVTGGLLAIDNYLVLISRVIYKNQVKAYEDNFCAYRNQWLFLFSSSLHFMAVFGIIMALFCICWGRILVLRSSAILLLLGITSATWFSNVFVEAISLVFIGFGVGLIHQVTRIIYNEAIPKDARWDVFEWGVIVGSVLAVATNYLASYFHVWGWRMSYSLPGIPTLFLLILSSFLIESPHYHIEQNRLEMANIALRAMRVTDIEVEFSELVAFIGRKQLKNALREIITLPNRPTLIITTFEIIFESMSGVDLLIFYGPFLLDSFEFLDHVEFLAPLIVALIQATAKGVGALCMRWIGRKKTFLPAYLAAITPLVCLTIIFHLNPNQHHHLKSRPVTISIVMVAIHAFSNGILLGPYGWIDSSFPEECAELGSTYGHCLGLFATFVANQIFLHLLCGLREWTFLFYAIYSFLMMCFTVGFIPETTGMNQHNMVRRTLRQHWFWVRYTNT